MELSANPSKFTSRYQLQSLTGEGGGGSVYCAWDTQLSRAVAIKRLKTDMASDASQAALRVTICSTVSPWMNSMTT